MNGSKGKKLGEGFANGVASFGFNHGGNSIIKCAQARVILGWVGARPHNFLPWLNPNLAIPFAKPSPSVLPYEPFIIKPLGWVTS